MGEVAEGTGIGPKITLFSGGPKKQICFSSIVIFCIFILLTSYIHPEYQKKDHKFVQQKKCLNKRDKQLVLNPRKIMFFRVLINSLVLLAAYFHLKLILYEGQDAKDHFPRQNFLIFSVTKIPGLKTLRKGQRYRFEQIRPVGCTGPISQNHPWKTYVMPFGLYFKVCKKKVANSKKNPRNGPIFGRKSLKWGFAHLKMHFRRTNQYFFIL